MADQNQSSGFDLKIPPPNLPTGNVPPFPARPPAPPPAPLKPPQPSPVGLSAFPPPAPKIVTGAVPPPPPAPSPNIKSSIRTMQDDLAALDKGTPPVGITPGKPVSAIPKPPITPAPPVPPPRPVFVPPPHPSGIPIDRPSPGIGAQIAVPPTPKKPIFNRSGLLAILTVLIIGGFSLWFLVFYEPSPAVVESPTPSITVTPTPMVIPPLESAFTIFEKITAPLTPSFFSELEKLVNKEQLVAGEPGLFRIISASTSAAYPFLDFALGTDVPAYPASVQAQIYDDSLYLTMLTKTDGKLSHGFILKAKDAIGLAAALKDWEPTMTNDLKKLFSLNTARAAIAGFLDNTYQGAAIRYRNFPDPLNTIDYAVVDAPNGESYLVFASSKAHIYAVIDKIKSIDSGAVPGK